MDKIQKFLKRLTPKEREAVLDAIEKILGQDGKKLDVKKLKGHEHIYRVRIGTIRIIFSTQESEIIILEISRRSEDTYKNF